MDISSFMLSGVLNHEVTDWLTVYAGGGAGIAMSDYTGGSLAQYPGLHSEDTQPTWMAMAGARAQLFNSPASIFLEGQYHAASDFEIAPGAIAEYSVLGAMTGLRWNF
jgi:opacity protein-like surface antigen